MHKACQTIGASLLCCLVAAAPCAEPGPRLFDQDSLGTLLGQLREFNEALQRGLDESTGEIMQELPGLWRELQVIEDQLQRKLPLLREQLQALERELREWETPPHRQPPPPSTLIAV